MVVGCWGGGAVGWRDLIQKPVVGRALGDRDVLALCLLHELLGDGRLARTRDTAHYHDRGTAVTAREDGLKCRLQRLRVLLLELGRYFALFLVGRRRRPLRGVALLFLVALEVSELVEPAAESCGGHARARGHRLADGWRRLRQSVCKADGDRIVELLHDPLRVVTSEKWVIMEKREVHCKCSVLSGILL